MPSCQLAPLRGELEFVIRRCRVFERMVNAVVIKKHSEYFMSRSQGGIDELIRGIPGIGLVRAGVNLDREFHWGLNLVPTQRVTAIKLRNTLVPKLRLGNPGNEALASRDGKLELPTPNSQAGAWELAQ